MKSASTKPLTAALIALLFYCILLTAAIAVLYANGCQRKPEEHRSEKEMSQLKMEIVVLTSEMEKLKRGYNDLIESRTVMQGNMSESDVDRREVLSGKTDTDRLQELLQNSIRGPPGPPGPPGQPGREGRDSVSLPLIDRHIEISVSSAIDAGMEKVKSLIKTTPVVSGTSYVRFGRTVCPAHSTVVYMGRVGGTKWNGKGGSSQFICLPEDPEYKITEYPSGPYLSAISGTEYKHESKITSGKKVNAENMPCVVCETGARTDKLMIPAKQRCPDSDWTLEYRGFLSTEYINDDGRLRKEYVCVDEDPEIVPGMAGPHYPAFLYHTTIECNTTGFCPPYKPNTELTCVVCSK